MNEKMLRLKCAAGVIALVVTGLSVNIAGAQGRDSNEWDNGVDVLTRGPVHEAFAETISFDPEPGIIVPEAPREIIEEVPPDYRPEGVNVAWIPGYWAWEEDRGDFIWISGIWRDLPPGRQWVPGYWRQVHRGFQWISGFWADSGVSETEYLPEPPESIEYGPSSPPPAVNQGWIPGSWLWRQDRYLWRPGYWAAGRENWVWIPDHYTWSPRGCVFSEGYWDHTVERRGVLFAPVYFEPEVYARPRYTYSPTYSINLTVFSDQLFVRPRYQHYYFGDYYDRRYQDSGFFASFSYQSSHRGYDPIYAHRGWKHRRDRGWERRDRDNFAHRRDFADARPPRTLRLQREHHGRDTRSGETRIEVAVRFGDLTRRGDQNRFRKVNRSEREELAQRGRGIQKSRSERHEVEDRPNSSDENHARSDRPVRRRAPKPLIVSKPTDQLGQDRTPPKRHRTPATDSKVEPRARRADRDSDGDRKSYSGRPDSRPQRGKDESKADKDEPKRDSHKRKHKKDSKDDSDD